MLGEYLGAGASTTKGLWHLNGNSTDSSGNGNNGTDTDITYGLAYGKLGQGALFDGDSSKIVLTDADWDWIEYNQALTISCWIKYGRASYSSYIQDPIFGKFNHASPYNGFLLGLETRVTSKANLQVILQKHFQNTNERLIVYSTDMLQYYNTWKHLVITYDGSGDYEGVNFYLDGTLQSKTVLGANYENCNSTIQNDVKASIGNFNGDTPTKYWLGSIDEVVIENVVWGAEKIKKYYTYSKGRFGIC